MNIEFLEKIKKLTLFALMADETLMGMLVLKGGNALNLAYDMSSRGSMDIDFSMERDFTADERNNVQARFYHLLNEEFNKEDLQVIDVMFIDKPRKIVDEVKDFWGGYLMEFKVVTTEQFALYSKDHPQKLSKEALPLNENLSPKFSVDFSKYEYVAEKRPQDIDGNTVFVYSPEMIALEKVRALCQQDIRYKEIIISMTPRARARDFFDIYKLKTQFNIDFKTEKNITLLKNIFAAKRVPVEFICAIKENYEFHFQDWDSVLQTITDKEVHPFKFYFDFLIKELEFICT
jgi:predicted nucleotidyltransferase component of viral defense system